MPKQPNILFLLSDEHSFRFMNHQPRNEGGEPCFTPNFDDLASVGTVFADTYCQMPLCTPSRISLLTGREVRGAGAWNNGSVIRPELPTIPRVLGAAGYATCLVGKMHLSGNLQFVGFQHRPYGDLTGRTGHQWEPLRGGDAQGMRGRTVHTGVTDIPESMIQDQVVCHESVAWIREQTAANPDQPWFLCASFSRPHFPLTAPKRWIDRYLGRIPPPKVGATGDAYDHPMSVGMREGFRAGDIAEDEMMRARAAYFACVSYLDEVLGDFFTRLDRDGMLDNTIVVYTTDHGEMAGEHGVWWKNGWYEACTRVPLIVSTPEQRRGIAKPNRYHTPVGLTDLFPTFCGLAGVDKPEGLQGLDLSAAIRGRGEPAARPIPCDNMLPRWGAGTEFRSVRLGDYKYVRFRNAPELLFNVVADPGEQTNLIDSTAADDRAALAKLRAWVDETMDFDAAEKERVERDGPLALEYPLNKDQGTQNLYMRRDGLLVSAEDALYNPTIVTDQPDRFFGDYPQPS